MQIQSIQGTTTQASISQQISRAQAPDSTPRAEAPAEHVAEQHNEARFVHVEPESQGRYQLKPAPGGPEVCFEPPTGGVQNERTPQGTRETDASSPQKPTHDDEPEPERGSVTRCSTDNVDREIEKLEARVKDLKQQVTAADGADKDGIEEELRSAERELALKDNDIYRRQHAQFTEIS